MALVLIPTVFAGMNLHYIDFSVPNGQKGTATRTVDYKFEKYAINWNSVSASGSITNLHISRKVLGNIYTNTSNVDYVGPVSGSRNEKTLNAPAGDYKFEISSKGANISGTVYVTDSY